MLNETIGWIGNILFAICAFPQVIKTFRTKRVGDLSIVFLILWFVGELLTFIYIIISDITTGILHLPLYFNYIVNIFLAAFLIYAKFVYPKKYNAINI